MAGLVVLLLLEEELRRLLQHFPLALDVLHPLQESLPLVVMNDPRPSTLSVFQIVGRRTKNGLYSTLTDNILDLDTGQADINLTKPHPTAQRPPQMRELLNNRHNYPESASPDTLTSHSRAAHAATRRIPECLAAVGAAAASLAASGASAPGVECARVFAALERDKAREVSKEQFIRYFVVPEIASA